MILFSTMFLYEYPLDRIVKAVELSGCDGLEFWVETPDFWIDRRIERLYEIKEYIGAIHGAIFDLNPCSVNQHVVEATVKENLFAVNIASKLDRVLTIHAGKRSALREPVEEDHEALQRYFRILKKYGEIKNAIILLENSEPHINYLCKDYEEVIGYAKKFGFGITLDVNHAMKNGDLWKYLESVELIKNLHVSSYDEKGRHTTARNDERVKKFLWEIRDTGYEGLITIELDDLSYGEMTYEDKIEELKKEREFLEKFI